MNQQPQDALTAAYRRASEADAGRPSAATRNAILAEAAKVAHRSAPAANESRYWPRMVAGIAVLGLGVLLWRQTDYRMPGDPPVVVLTQPTAEVEPVPERARAPAPVPKRSADSGRVDTQVAVPSPAAPSLAIPSPAIPSPAQISPAKPPGAQPDPFPNSPGLVVADAPPPVPPAAPPPPSITAPAAPPRVVLNEPDDQELAEAQVTGSRTAAARGGGQMPRAGQAPRAGGAAAPGGQAARQGVDRVALLRQHFPAHYQSDAPHSLWLVQNAAGEVLLSGELAPGQRPEDLAPQIAGALGGRVPGPWQTGTVRNAREQPITLAIARVP